VAKDTGPLTVRVATGPTPPGASRPVPLTSSPAALNVPLPASVTRLKLPPTVIRPFVESAFAPRLVVPLVNDRLSVVPGRVTVSGPLTVRPPAIVTSPLPPLSVIAVTAADSVTSPVSVRCGEPSESSATLPPSEIESAVMVRFGVSWTPPTAPPSVTSPPGALMVRPWVPSASLRVPVIVTSPASVWETSSVKIERLPIPPITTSPIRDTLPPSVMIKLVRVMVLAVTVTSPRML
jgi:hypothetical protein